MNSDRQHLSVLSVLHYVHAGLLVFGSCGTLFLLGIGVFFLVAPPVVPPPRPNQPPGPDPSAMFAMIGSMYTAMGAIGTAIIWLEAAASIAAARCLSGYRRWLLCNIAAGVCCFHMPIGTVLGIFTILVLQRPTVKLMFEAVERGEPMPEYLPGN
jgi:hypothetical protein